VQGVSHGIITKWLLAFFQKKAVPAAASNYVGKTMMKAQLKTNPRFAFAGLVSLMTAACCLAWSSAALAASVSQARGDVRVERAGSSSGGTVLRSGQRLAEGDTLVTGQGGEVFLRMDDGGALAVRENSRVLFAQLRLRARGAGAVPQEERGQVLRMTVGALRYVTGLVGKRRPAAIGFSTPTATVGIRGTDLDVVVREVADVDILPGTYVQVNSGGVVMESTLAAQVPAPSATTTDPVQLTLSANEAGFVGEPIVERSGRRSASSRKLAANNEVFKRSSIDQLFR
jgi:hypothetical protein